MVDGNYKENIMKTDQARNDTPLGDEAKNQSPDRISDAKKIYETPEINQLGDVAELTNYDVSVIV